MSYHIRARQRERRNEAVFRALIASPDNLDPNFVLPANAELAISHSASISAGSITITAGSRSIKTTALAANEKQRIGWFERSKILSFAAPTGTLKLYLVLNNGVFKEIGSRSF